MPFVDVECSEHGRQETYAHNLAGVTVLPCPSCEEPSRRLYTWSGGFSIDFRDGYDIGAGEYFNTARERDSYLAQKGLVKRD